MNQSVSKSISSPAVGGAVFMVAAGLFFALVNTCVQSATMQFGLASSSVAFWQYLIALLLAIPWLLRRGIKSLRTDQLGLHVVRVVFAAAGVQFWVLGLASVPIWQAIALIMTSPFFATAGAGLLLREPVGPARWFAVAVGFAGGMIILAPWSDSFGMATLYPLTAAALWAMASLLTKRLTVRESVDTVTVYLLLLLTPINAAVAVVDGFEVPSGQVQLLLLGAGLLTVLAQYALTRAYAAADAAYVQPFDHLKLPLNVLMGWLVFGFVPPGSMWLGAVIIIGASAYIFHHEAGLETRAKCAPARS